QPPPVLNPAPSAPWSAVRDADDVSTIAAALAPRAHDSAPFPSFPPPVVSPVPARPTAVRAPFDMSARPRSEWVMPSITMLTEPKKSVGAKISMDALEQNARLLEGVLDDFGVKGEIVKVRPGPVVTLYELEPAPGIKASRVIGLADDIARSMSAISVRVAVVPGSSVIGIELPNTKAETVYLRELLDSPAYERHQGRLALALGKDIGGEAVVADLARMPHL